MGVGFVISPPTSYFYMDDSSQYLSEYEKIRLDNIKRNSEFLKSLGLETAKSSLDAPKAEREDNSNASPRKRKVKSEPVVETRKSPRFSENKPDTSEVKVLKDAISDPAGVDKFSVTLIILIINTGFRSTRRL